MDLSEVAWEPWSWEFQTHNSPALLEAVSIAKNTVSEKQLQGVFNCSTLFSLLKSRKAQKEFFPPLVSEKWM